MCDVMISFLLHELVLDLLAGKYSCGHVGLLCGYFCLAKKQCVFVSVIVKFASYA
jgi:hypothetical protein